MNRLGASLRLVGACALCAVVCTQAGAWEIQRITDNSVDDVQASAHGGGIAWQGTVGAYRDIYYWNGTTTINLSNTPDVWDCDPSVYNGTVAWSNGESIYYWDGYTTVAVATAPEPPVQPPFWTDYYSPSLYDGKIAWVKYDYYYVNPDVITYYWDGNSIRSLGSPYNLDYYNIFPSPCLYDGKVAFCDCFGLKYWDGASTTLIDEGGRYPSLYDGTIAYCKYNSETQENDVYYWDGVTITNISNDPLADDSAPSLYDGKIAWTRHYLAGNDDNEVVFWNGTGVQQITNNTVNDACVSLFVNQPQIAFQSQVATGNWEIMLAVPEPAPVYLVAIGLSGVALYRRWKKRR